MVKLADRFEKKSHPNKLLLRRHFFMTMMEKFDYVLFHVIKLKNLAEQLEAVCDPVCDDILVITLLDRLSDSYQFFITVMESRFDILSWLLVKS